MTFAEKLKSIRKKAGLSQEQLAEKLGVSRQAVTKWETETGIPDIENMMAISALFDISIDELLSNERGMKKSNEYLFESVTEYDIDEPKRYDMKFGGAKQFVLSGYEGEKIRVRLVSNTLSTLQNDFKVKIDDIRKRIDVDVIRKNGISEATAKETVSIFVQIPIPYVGKIEGAVNAETVEIRSLDCDSIELDVKTPNIILNDVGGTVEINCNLDMSVVCNSLKGYLAINQVSATSKIHIPEGEVFTAVTKGIGTSISYEKDGRQTERFDTPDAENVIELNGIKSELVANHTVSYLPEGYFGVAGTRYLPVSFSFPLKRCFAVSLVIDKQMLSTSTRKMMAEIPINLDKIGETLGVEKKWYIEQPSSSLQHLFTEIYEAKGCRHVGYFKIKAIELLYYMEQLTQINSCDFKYFDKRQIEATKAIRDYLIGHLDEKISLECLAKEAHLNLTVFHNIFFHIYGDTPYAYLKKYKMNLAAKLLLDGKRKIGDIALELGYNNASKFTKAFQSVYGVLPKDYRKNK